MTDNLPERIPEDIAEEVINRACQLYSEAQNSYSLSELQQLGKEVQIPPEIIQEAIRQVQKQKRQAQQKRQQIQSNRKNFQIVGISLAAVIFLWSILIYNNLISSSQAVDTAWAQVENQLQRKANLIPNLIQITQAQAEQENQLIERLEKAHQNYLQAQNREEKVKASEIINSALNQFNQYANSNLKSFTLSAYTNLQYEIAGTENRISVERMRYNQTVQIYNQQVKSFPNSLIARLTGLQPKPILSAQSSNNN